MDIEVLDIVMSIRDEYLTMIMNGDKTIELRRKAVNVPPGSRIWLYAKWPVAHISACATVQRVVTASPAVVWSLYRSAVGITRDEFDSYFEGSLSACAILLENVRCVVPALKLDDLRSCLNGFHPPQFFKKLNQGSPELLLLRSHMG